MRNWMRSLSAELAHAYIIESDGEFLGAEAVSGASKDAPGRSAPAREIISMLAEMHGIQAIDVKFMEREAGQSYKVKDAEAFQEKLSMRPYGPMLVGIIEDADGLSEIIQNKLLKTLEEPEPGTVLFLLCRNREAFLPTVRSRCVLLRESGGTDEGAYKESGSARNSDEGAYEERSGARSSDKWDGNELYEDFYIYRKFIEKNIKSKEEANEYLLMLEEKERDAMLNAVSEADSVAGGAADELTLRVRMIENAREDIAKGMGYKQALKKMYLELH